MSGTRYTMKGMIWHPEMTGIRSDLMHERFLVGAHEGNRKGCLGINCFHMEENPVHVEKNVQKLGRRPSMGTGEPGCRNGKH